MLDPKLTTPDTPEASDAEIAKLAAFVGGARRLLVLGGAGCSTESGIPDYRSPGGVYADRKPMTYQVFTQSEAARRRYWARSMVGWARFSSARPNAAHVSLAALERAGALSWLITQNVDRLHQQAGSREVVELHGSNHEVICLDCGLLEPRVSMQRRMEGLNSHWLPSQVALAPDGDAELSLGSYDAFVLPTCLHCGGRLKTNVVFFGESVPRDRVDLSFQRVAASDALLVVGSSLTVWSGYRFVKAAVAQGLPVAAVSCGPTRADAELNLKLERRLGDVLPRLSAALGC